MTKQDEMTQSLPALDGRIISVLRYWDGLRGNRIAPGRIEISPSAITRHLSRICILERPRAGTVRIRLAGATLSSRAGMELRGMPFRSLFDLDYRALAMDAAETAITTPAVSFLALARPERAGPAPEAMLAILPLTDTSGRLTRAMAVYSEHASVSPFVADIRGRFMITDNWSMDIPESGPIIGPMGNVKTITPHSTHLMRPRLASAAPVPALQAQDLHNHSRQVFQVIDGGLA